MNGTYLLNPSTVHDDAAVDSLSGGQDLDWFFAHVNGPNADLVKSKNGEVVTVI
jgi:hypothetical protein